MHYAISTEVLGQTQHVIYTTQTIKLFEFINLFIYLFLYFLWVFEFFLLTKKQSNKVRSTKQGKQNKDL